MIYLCVTEGLGNQLAHLDTKDLFPNDWIKM
jgi:hypothetical protein